MNKFSIVEFAKMISEAHGDAADAIIIIRSNGSKCHADFIGTNTSCTDPNAVQLAATMSNLLKDSFSTALKIHDLLCEKDLLGSRCVRDECNHILKEQIPVRAPDKQQDKPAVDKPSDNAPPAAPQLPNKGKEHSKQEREVAEAIGRILINLLFGGDFE